MQSSSIHETKRLRIRDKIIEVLWWGAAEDAFTINFSALNLILKQCLFAKSSYRLYILLYG